MNINFLLIVIKQIKGTDAASAMGTEAAIYASEASDNNDLLEAILPATVSAFVDLVKLHLSAGEILFCILLSIYESPNNLDLVTKSCCIYRSKSPLHCPSAITTRDNARFLRLDKQESC